MVQTKKYYSLYILFTVIQIAQCVFVLKNSQDKKINLKNLGEPQQLTQSQRLIFGDYPWSNSFKQTPVLTQVDKDKCESNNDCLNEGICHEKACYCKSYFVGPICQYELSKPIELNEVVFYIILLFAIIAGILIMVLINYIIRRKQDERLRREGEYNDNKYEIWTAQP